MFILWLKFLPKIEQPEFWMALVRGSFQGNGKKWNVVDFGGACTKIRPSEITSGASSSEFIVLC